MNKDDYIITPSNECFVNTSVKKGILPLILDELLAARKRAKKDMAAATDPMVRLPSHMFTLLSLCAGCADHALVPSIICRKKLYKTVVN